MNLAVGQSNFQITCLDRQTEIVEEYQFLQEADFHLGEQVKFGVTRPDGQVGVNSCGMHFVIQDV